MAACHKGKMLYFNGMADQIIPAKGSTQYYVQAAAKLGGFQAAQQTYRYYLVPGMGHCLAAGSVNGITGVSPPADRQFWRFLKCTMH